MNVSRNDGCEASREILSAKEGDGILTLLIEIAQQ